jgi:hypothetical protein
MPDATTASDWLPTFEFGLANDSSYLKRPVRVSGAEGRFTLNLDAHQSSSRSRPTALNVDRPTAAFEASEVSLSTHRRRRRFSDRLTGVPCHRPFVALVAKNQNSVRTVIRDCSPATSAKTEPSGRSETDWRYGDDPKQDLHACRKRTSGRSSTTGVPAGRVSWLMKKVKPPPVSRRGLSSNGSSSAYGRAIVIVGVAQVSQCAGLFASPSALRTDTFTT